MNTRPRLLPWRLLAFALLVAAPGGSPAHAGPVETLYGRCQAACAEVLLAGRHVGSAWFADANGSAITAAHLFERRNPAVELLLADNRRLPARLIAVDRGYDVALLQVEAGHGPFKSLALGARRPTVGEEIFQFGAPLFRNGLLQPGRVGTPETKFEFLAGVTDYAEVVPVAAVMQGGTSGGPWLNRRGEVVGVQSSVMSLEEKPVGIAFVAPALAVRRLLKERNDARTPTLGLGVDELWQQSAEFLARLPTGTNGLVAAVVREGGPAAHAGIVSRDVLISVDSQPVVRIADLLRTVRRYRPGDTIALTVLRPGETDLRQVSAVLGCAEDVGFTETAVDSAEKGRP